MRSRLFGFAEKRNKITADNTRSGTGTHKSLSQKHTFFEDNFPRRFIVKRRGMQ